MEKHRLVGRLRLPKINILYWLNQLKEFADYQCEGINVSYIEFGKQDSRGAYSICWYNSKDIVIKQVHFESKDMMLGFIQGCNSVINFIDLKQFA